MNLTHLVLTVALTLACSSGETGTARVEQSGTVVDTSRLAVADSNAIALVAAFYASYVPDGIVSGLGAVDRIIVERPEFFTSQLLDALRRDVAARAAADGVIDGLDFDPFLASQDPCDRYEVGRGSTLGERVRVEIFAICASVRRAEPAVLVDVVRVDGRWALANWIYGPPGDDLVSVLNRLHP